MLFLELREELDEPYIDEFDEEVNFETIAEDIFFTLQPSIFASLRLSHKYRKTQIFWVNKFQRRLLFGNSKIGKTTN